MAKPNRHIVHEQVFEINLEGVKMKAAYDIQNQVSELNRNQLMDIMSDVFDEFSKDGIHHRFDHLEIDLGDIKRHDFKKTFATIFKIKLRKALKEAIAKGSDKTSETGYQRLTSGQSKEEIIRFYLEEGRLPWQSSTSSEDLENVFKNLTIQKPQQVYQLLHSISNKKQLYGRITSRFSSQLIERLLSIIEPANARRITQFIKRWKRLQSNNAEIKIKHSNFEQTLWKEAFLLLEENINIKHKDIVSLLLDKVSKKLKIDKEKAKYLKVSLIKDSDKGISDTFKDEHNDLDLFRYYLKHGSLPYWSNIGGKDELENLLDQLLSKNPKGIYNVFQLEIKNDAAVFLRILYQFNKKTIIQILADILSVNDVRKEHLYKRIEQYKLEVDASSDSAKLIQRLFFKILNRDYSEDIHFDKNPKYDLSKEKIDEGLLENKKSVDYLLHFISKKGSIEWDTTLSHEDFESLLKKTLDLQSNTIVQSLRLAVVEKSVRDSLLKQVSSRLYFRLMDTLLGSDIHAFVLRLQSVIAYLNQYLPSDAPSPESIFNWDVLYEAVSAGKSASYIESLLAGEWIKRIPVSKKYLALLFRDLSENAGGQTLQLARYKDALSIQDIATRILLRLPVIKEEDRLLKVSEQKGGTKPFIEQKKLKEEPAAAPENATPFDYLLHFLVKGVLPTWGGTYDGEGFSFLLGKSLDHQSDTLAQRLRLAVMEKSVQERLLQQVPKEFHYRLMEILLGRNTHTFILRLQSVITYLNQHLPSGTPSPESIFNWDVLYEAVSAGRSTSYIESLLTGEWIKRVPVSKKHLALLFRDLSESAGGQTLQLARHKDVMSIQDIATRILLRLPTVKDGEVRLDNSDMEAFLGRDTNAFILRLQSVITYLNQYLPSGAPSPESIFNWDVLYEAVSAGKSTSYIESLFTGEWIKRVPVSKKHLALLFRDLSENAGGQTLQLARHKDVMSIQDIATRILLRLPTVKKEERLSDIMESNDLRKDKEKPFSREKKLRKKPNVPPENSKPLDYLLHFLIEGELPAWGGSYDGEGFSSLLEKSLDHQSDTLAQQLRLVLVDKPVQERLLRQVPKHFRTRLMEILLGRDTYAFVLRLQSVIAYLNQHLPSNAPSPESIFNWDVLYKAMSGGKSASYIESLLTGEWIKRVPVSKKHLALLFRNLSESAGGKTLQLARHKDVMSIQDIATRILLRLPTIKEGNLLSNALEQKKLKKDREKPFSRKKKLGKDLNVPPKNPKPLDYLLYFLIEGGLPAWGGPYDGEGFSSLLEKSLEHQSDILAQQLRLVLVDKPIQDRLLRQVPKHLHTHLMEIVLGRDTYAFVLRLQSVIAYLNQYLPDDTLSPESIFNWGSLYEGLSAGKSASYMESLLTGEWINRVPVSKKYLALLFQELSESAGGKTLQLARHKDVMSIQDIATRILLRLPRIKKEERLSDIIESNDLRKDDEKSLQDNVSLSENPTSLDYLLYFLREGKLPLWGEIHDGEGLESLLEKSLSQKSDDLAKKLRQITVDKSVRNRLLQKVPKRLRFQLIEVLFGKDTHAFIIRLQSVITYLNRYLPATTPSPEDIFDWQALYEALSTGKSASYMGSMLTGEWINRVPVSKKYLALLFSELSKSTGGRTIYLVGHQDAMSIQDIAIRILLRLPAIKEGDRLTIKPDGTFFLPKKEEKEDTKIPLVLKDEEGLSSQEKKETGSEDSPPKNPVSLDYLMHFLKHGKRPWWDSNYDNASVVELLEKCLDEDTPSLLRAIKIVIDEPTIKKRLFQQLPDKLQTRLLVALLSEDTHAALLIFQSVIVFLKSYLPPQASLTEDLFQWDSFYTIALSGKGRIDVENSIIEEWLGKIPVKPTSLAMLFWHLTQRGGAKDVLLFEHKQAKKIQGMAMKIRDKLPYQRVENELQTHFKEIFLYPEDKKPALLAVRKWLASGFVDKPLAEQKLIRIFIEYLTTQPSLMQLLIQQHLNTQKSRQLFIELFPVDVVIRLFTISTSLSMRELGVVMKGATPTIIKLLGISQKEYESLLVNALLDYLVFQPGKSQPTTVAWFILNHISLIKGREIEKGLLKELPKNHPLNLAKKEEESSLLPITSKTESMPSKNNQTKNPAINPFARKSKSKKNKKGIPKRRIRTKKGEDAVPEKNSIFIKNAGLIILHPYLPPLFRRLGIDPSKEEDKGRAAHLLQYLNMLSSSSPEEDLPLNKILVGMPLKEPIISSVELTDIEKETCNGLIKGACQNWPQMKASSVMNFRVSFLIRDGLLTETENHWKLVVDQKPYDLLMKTLPWGISMVKYPWMPKSIVVTWA